MSYASVLRLTNADVEAMPDDGNRYELIDGDLYVSGPAQLQSPNDIGKHRRRFPGISPRASYRSDHSRRGSDLLTTTTA